MREDDTRQAGPLTRGSIGAGGGGAGTSGTGTSDDGPRTGVALKVMEDLTEMWQVSMAVECVLADSGLKKAQIVKARHPKRRHRLRTFL